MKHLIKSLVFFFRMKVREIEGIVERYKNEVSDRYMGTGKLQNDSSTS